MDRNQATPVDALAPNRVHRLPFPRLASRPRQADRRVKVVAAAMILETPQTRISRQIPGAAGSNVLSFISIGEAHQQKADRHIEQAARKKAASAAVLVVVRPLSAQPETSFRVTGFRARDLAAIHAGHVGRPVARLANIAWTGIASSDDAVAVRSL
jgi:hypothetical protein